VDLSDLSDLSILVNLAPCAASLRTRRCAKCEFETESVWSLAQHIRSCKLRRRRNQEKYLMSMGHSRAVCLLLREHLHCPVSSFDEIVGINANYFVGGADALSVVRVDAIVNCAEELGGLINPDILTLVRTCCFVFIVLKCFCSSVLLEITQNFALSRCLRPIVRDFVVNNVAGEYYFTVLTDSRVVPLC
jgi:hypothetical protein